MERLSYNLPFHQERFLVNLIIIRMSLQDSTMDSIKVQVG
jgi:hypothetical protein